MAYATLNELKSYMGIGTTTDDALLSALLTRAQAVIDDYCGRTFEAAADTTRYFDAVEAVWGQLLLSDTDIYSVTTVVNGDGVTINSSEYVLQPSNARPAYAIRLKDNASVAWTYSDSPERSIVVTGRFAYSLTAPDNIKHVCIRLASWFYRQKDSAGDLDTTNITSGGAVITPGRLPNDVQQMLKRYIR